eukprot:65194_1
MATIPGAVHKPLRYIVSTISALSIVGIFIYHAFNFSKTSQSKQTCGIPVMLSFTMFIFGAFIIFFWFGTAITGDTILSCDISMMGLPDYILFKLNLYLILVYRLHDVFPEYYSPKKLQIWSAILCIWSLLNAILVNIGLQKTFNENIFKSCNLESNELGLMSMMLEDLVAVTINSYCFIKPVIKLKNQLNEIKYNNSAYDNTIADLTKVAVKACILSCTTVFSSFIALIGIILVDIPDIWLCIDIIVSLLSIALMYKWASPIVDKMCCCCLRGYEEYENNVSHLKKTMNATTNEKVESHEIDSITNKNVESTNDKDATSIEIR